MIHVRIDRLVCFDAWISDPYFWHLSTFPMSSCPHFRMKVADLKEQLNRYKSLVSRHHVPSPTRASAILIEFEQSTHFNLVTDMQPDANYSNLKQRWWPMVIKRSEFLYWFIPICMVCPLAPPRTELFSLRGGRNQNYSVILSSAKISPCTAYCFHANARATSQHTFERSCGHSKVCCVVAQTFAWK